MSLTDPVAEFLSQIRSAIRARRPTVDVPASKLRTEIARILKEEAYISSYKTLEEGGKQVLRVYLKYGATEAAIRDLSRISRPGCRVYVGRGIDILTTPKGVMTTPSRGWKLSLFSNLIKEGLAWERASSLVKLAASE